MKDKELQRLVTEAKRGKQAAFTSLYEQTRDRAYFVACRYVSGNDVADMLQEAYTAAFGAIDTFDASREFEPWLHTILRNKCINHTKKKRELLTVDEEGGAEAADTEALVPGEWLEQREKREKIIGIIDRLPELQRIAVVLFYYEGHSVAEIAELLAIPEGTVKSRLSNARKSIKEEVLMEERKGNKLYGVAGAPVLTRIFQREEAAARIPAELSERVLKGTLSALSASGAAAGGAGIAAKFLALSMGAKAAAVSAAAVVVVAGVGVPVYLHNQPQEPVQPVVAAVDDADDADDASSEDGAAPVNEAHTASEPEQAASSETTESVASAESSEASESALVASGPEGEAAAASDSEPVSEAQEIQSQPQTPPVQQGNSGDTGGVQGFDPDSFGVDVRDLTPEEVAKRLQERAERGSANDSGKGIEEVYREQGMTDWSELSDDCFNP